MFIIKALDNIVFQLIYERFTFFVLFCNTSFSTIIFPNIKKLEAKSFLTLRQIILNACKSI